MLSHVQVAYARVWNVKNVVKLRRLCRTALFEADLLCFRPQHSKITVQKTRSLSLADLLVAQSCVLELQILHFTPPQLNVQINPEVETRGISLPLPV